MGSTDDLNREIEELKISHHKVRRKLFAEIGQIKRRMEILEASIENTHHSLLVAAQQVKWRKGEPEEVVSL